MPEPARFRIPSILRPAILRALVVLVALMSTLFATGCATSGSYDRVVEDNQRLGARIRQLERQNGELEKQVNAQREEMDGLRETQARLVADLEAEVASGDVAVSEVDRGVRLDVSEQILFESGSSLLSASGEALVRRIAARIKDDPGTVSVEGHADSQMVGESLRDRYPSNWELAAARAARVVRRLSAEGVDPERLRVVSYGPFSPVASNETAEGRKRNRRTEIILHAGTAP